MATELQLNVINVCWLDSHNEASCAKDCNWWNGVGHKRKTSFLNNKWYTEINAGQ